MNVKENFKQRYCALTDYDTFMEINKKPLRASLRVNTLKTTVSEITKRFPNLEPVPWCKEGFYIKGYGVGNTSEHFLGYFYLQEAASMLPPLVLDAQPDDTVLDMAAAPGSKTTQIAAMMQNTGLIVANDYPINRLKALEVNMERCGVTNAIITRMYGQAIKGITFDKILLDAPCSGIGTIRKSPKTLDIYNPGMSKKLAGVQKRMINSAWNILNKNGTLVYSTCTLEPEENEAVISYALENLKGIKIEKINLPLKRSPPVMAFEGQTYHEDVKHVLRIWPQDNDSEGFFVAKLTKE